MVRFVRRALVAAAACGLFALGNTRGTRTGAGARGHHRHRHVHLVRGEHGSFSRLLSRRLRHGGAGDAGVRRASVQPFQSPALRDVRHPGRKGTPPVRASAWHAGSASRSWKSRTSRTRRTSCASRIPAMPRSSSSCAISTPRSPAWRRANAPIVTPGGKPVTMSDGSRAILINDIDKRFIEIRQPASLPETAAAATNNIVDVRLSISVNDMDRTL